MEYSNTGLHLTKQFESCRLVAYLDSKRVPTIGWGHTHGVKLGDVCTQEQADAWLLGDVQSAVNAVNRLVKVPLTQNEFDALVDFAFNVGNGALEHSTLLIMLNAGDYHGAAGQFERWDKCAGKELAGLLLRRKTEEQLFQDGMAEQKS